MSIGYQVKQNLKSHSFLKSDLEISFWESGSKIGPATDVRTGPIVCNSVVQN